MARLEPDVLSKIRAVMEVTSCQPGAAPELIAEVERGLGVPFPAWLRDIYCACNGFCGPTGVVYLYRLDGSEGVLEFTLFLRGEWALPWLERAIVFSDNGLGGSITTHWVALDGQLIEWCYGHGGDYTVLDYDLFEVWRREQEFWDEITRNFDGT
jgi:hypothetical protein